MKEFSRMEDQRETLFKKEEEKTRELMKIREGILEEREKTAENMKVIKNVENEIKKAKETIIKELIGIEKNEEERTSITLQTMQREFSEADEKKKDVEV
jgi:hypothetical protein